MSHADVVALLDAAALVPGRIRALVSAETEEGVALRGHLAECEECRREVDAWQAVDEALVAVTPGTLAAPAAARPRILSNVMATGVARGPDRILGARGTVPTAAATSTTGGPSADAVPTPPGATVPTALPRATPDAAPNAGRVWRTTAGAPIAPPTPPAPPVAGVPPVVDDAAPAAGAPEAAPGASAGRRSLRVLAGGRGREGVGFRVFLAVAAAAVFLFALGAALGGPLGLTAPQVVPDTAARVELEKILGRMSDLLQVPGAIDNWAPLTDQEGEPAGAVVLGLPETNLLGVVTRALPTLDGGQRYVCILVRGDERYDIGYMKFANDPAAEGDVAYWVGPLGEEVPLNAGLPGDVFTVFVEGDTGGPPLLSATF